MSQKARRILIIVMIIMTLVLGGLSLYLSFSLQGDDEPPPDDTGVSGGTVVCGGTCSKDADCATATTGVATACVNNKCVSTSCPTATIYGTRCDCNIQPKTCGQKCGYWAGNVTCATGTKCAYVNGPSCTGGFTQTTGGPTYCVPTTAANITLTKCVGNDTQNSYATVKNQPQDLSTKTPAEIATLLCAGCGNGTVDAGEQCDLGAQNGAQGVTCDTTCKTKVITVCNNGIDDDGDGKVDCTAGAEDPGCFPNGNGGGGACNPADSSEEDIKQCRDGIDNDGDGKIDCTAGASDPGCFPDGNGGGGVCNPEDDNETDNVLPQCSDGIDNDADGKIDCTTGASDPGCFPDGAGGGGACDPVDEDERDGIKPQCRDGIDNDGDGMIDCTTGASDPGCFPDGQGGGGVCNPNDNQEIDLLPISGIFSSTFGYLAIGSAFLLFGFSLFKNSTSKKSRDLL